MKRLQNKIAESGFLLPTVTLVALAIALPGAWHAMLTSYDPQASLLCFAFSAYIMVELSNSNALIRVRSRMVTSTFVALSAAASLLVGPVGPSITQLCFVVATLLLFSTYQDKRSMGRTYYAFLFVGLATCTFVQTFFFVPLLWMLMATQLQSLSGRTWGASVLGLLTPYWLMLPWLIFQQDFSLWEAHVQRLASFSLPLAYASLTIGQVAAFFFTLVLAVVGMVHFWNRSYEDKIRIRLLYGYLSTMMLFCALFLVLQPQFYDTLMRLLLIFASPLIAHFFVLTSSKATNIMFFVVMALLVGVAILNILNV